MESSDRTASAREHERRVATIYAVAIAAFGGTAQLVVTWLLHISGNPLAPA